MQILINFLSPNWGAVKLKWMLPRPTPRETLLLIQAKIQIQWKEFQETKPRVKPMQTKKII